VNDETKSPPPAGFKEVDQDAYYKAVNPSPGTGTIVSQYERYGRGYVTEYYNNHNRARVIAVRYSGHFPFTPTQYFLPEDAQGINPQGGGQLTPNDRLHY